MTRILIQRKDRLAPEELAKRFFRFRQGQTFRCQPKICHRQGVFAQFQLQQKLLLHLIPCAAGAFLSLHSRNKTGCKALEVQSGSLVELFQVMLDKRKGRVGFHVGVRIGYVIQIQRRDMHRNGAGSGFLHLSQDFSHGHGGRFFGPVNVSHHVQILVFLYRIRILFGVNTGIRHQIHVW